MRRFAVLLSIALLVAGVPSAGASEDPPPCGPGDLDLLSDEVLSEDGRLYQLTLDSDAMRGTTGVRVLLPDGYAAGADDYPVLYLLHGTGDDETTWTTNTDVEGLTSGLDVIVVMPDAGNDPPGWYSDWETDEYCWESYHVGELVGFVDREFETIGSREGRVVAGLSMGGFGAMSYAARHPDLFAAAGSFSGAVDTADGSIAAAAAFEALAPFAGTPDDRVWGPYETNEVEWRDHNPADLATNLRRTDLWLSTGNGVAMPGDDPRAAPTEAGVYTMNRLFHRKLDREGIDHVFHDRGHGTHEWHYWEEDLALYLDHLFGGDGELDPLPASPEVFDHRRAAPDAVEAWGWSFGVDEDRAQEFLEATEVSDEGLTLRGSGTVEVTTPRRFAGRYEVKGSLEGEVVSKGRRLTFRVSLGAPHAEQQYTPEGRLAEASDPGYWREASVEITRISGGSSRRSRAGS